MSNKTVGRAFMSSQERCIGDELVADDPTRQWQTGDRAAALAAALEAVGPSLHAIARRIANDDAADVVQEALLRVWDHPERFDSNRGTLGGYLLVTTRGTALDHIRQAQRRRLREQRGSNVLDITPAREPIDEDLMARLRIAVDGLQDEQQALIAIAFFRGVSYRKIASELGVPEGTVKSRMRRTLTRLRDDLRLEDDETSSS
ncbi:MAG: sigma-70 family RNA polymerase sigma factor [Ilumatobacteraceae bacterium]